MLTISTSTRLAQRLAALGILLVVFAGLLTPVGARAASGASLPTFVHPVLQIPRVDVEGYGAISLSLVLQDEASLRFAIASAVPATAGLEPGATFTLGDGLLVIPTVKAGTAFHALRLQRLPGDVFQLLAAEEVVLPGQLDYTTQCAGCHGADGLGGAVGVSLKNCVNCTSLASLESKIAGTMPLGNPAACTGTCASTVAAYVLDVFNGTSSGGGTAMAAIEVLPLEATLRSAALQLVSRLPTALEQARVANEGETGIRGVLDGMMTEPAFYSRLSEIFNDWLLTNRYLSTNGGEAAIQLMRRYPNARWYDPGVANRGSDYVTLRNTTNDSVAREPLELINHVVRNDLPMTQMLTADYVMLNGYSAKSYGADTSIFTNEWDATEFRPVRLTGVPHAGILSSLMFLNRYPTSATNRNRARSRVVYDLFLDVDILALDGARPDGTAVDISSPAPTLENADCVKCHSLLDPVASSFQNWNLAGNFVRARSWYTDMFQAGFNGTAFPGTSMQEPLQWLSQRIVQDARFDAAIVRLVYTGLMGQEPLDAPGPDATAAETEAWLAESAHLDEIQARYVAANRTLKTLVKELVLSPYWRADGLSDPAQGVVHAATGPARLLTPEMLHRKLNALFGFEWRGTLNSYATSRNVLASARLLDSRQYYQQIYGGIDSFTITVRLGDPNGLMVLVQERMANEMACYAVPNDFLAQKTGRRLFAGVDITTQLTTAPERAAVRATIQHLHAYLLGETLALDSPEIEATYQLFAAVQVEGRKRVGVSELTTLPALCQRNNDLLTGASLNSGGVDGRLRNDPNYTIRAWMAVVAYLLSDYRFLYA
jgi:hypothetical protein